MREKKITGDSTEKISDEAVNIKDERRIRRSSTTSGLNRVWESSGLEYRRPERFP